VAGLVAVVVTLVNGRYGGTVVAVAIVVVMLASARRYARRHPRA
jgi:precorrin isomerase